jgi:hypothetical protein
MDKEDYDLIITLYDDCRDRIVNAVEKYALNSICENYLHDDDKIALIVRKAEKITLNTPQDNTDSMIDSDVAGTVLRVNVTYHDSGDCHPNDNAVVPIENMPKYVSGLLNELRKGETLILSVSVVD